jgi:hypothetical protein
MITKQQLHMTAIQRLGFNPFRKTRKRPVIQHRQAITYALIQLNQFTLEYIAELISADHHYDHSTVIHSRKTVLNDMATDSLTRLRVCKWCEIVAGMQQTVGVNGQGEVVGVRLVSELVTI